MANGATAATRGSGLGDLPGRYEDLMSRLRGMARGGAEGGVEAGQGGGSGVLGGGDADLGEYAGSEFDSYSGDEDKGAREHGDAAEASSGDERGGVYSDDFTGPGEGAQGMGWHEMRRDMKGVTSAMGCPWPLRQL